MSPLVSIFDITLIVDSICQSLTLYDIQACMRVSRHWSSAFKPRVWRTVKLPSIASLTKEKISTILENKHWIRSLTVDAGHIEQVSGLSLTTLRGLVLYNENFERTEDGDPVQVDAVIALIDNNASLWSLEIDLNWYHYQSRNLSPSLMLAIGRHPSLTKLTWHVPIDHISPAFINCLLYVCHKSIQEFHTCIKRTFPILRFRHASSLNSHSSHDSCPAFSLNDFADDQDNRNPEYMALKAQLGVPMDQLEPPFAIRKLVLPYGVDDNYIPLLRNCPKLEDTSIKMVKGGSGSIEGFKVLAECCPMLRRLDLTRLAYGTHYSDIVKLFSCLQALSLPCTDRQGDFGRVVHSLTETSQYTLEYLCVSLFVSAKEMVLLLSTFPNLKVLEAEYVTILIQEGTEAEGSLQGPYNGSEQDPNFEETIVQDWDQSQTYRRIGTIKEWWSQWIGAKRFMRDFRKAYVQYCDQERIVGRPIRMKFMWPIKAFMSRKDVLAFASGTGIWADGRRSITLADASLIRERGVAGRAQCP